ncbi:hypothetical protein JW926_01290 [Candidatus Sumerlaeota bacterium]|nr:hypothetical protein [Candidatus Sumerlaeota bacterium]
MKNIFLGGSRNITTLNDKIKDRIDNIIKNGFTVLIGDANGADKAIQEYLYDKKYQKVVVFCMDDMCRNNIGKWKINTVHCDKKVRDFSYYSQKDKIMSEEADYGLMLWDGKSKGTLNNILNLLERNKVALVYFSPEKIFLTIKNYDNLDLLIQKCDHESIQKFDRFLNLHQKMNNRQLHLKLA